MNNKRGRTYLLEGVRVLSVVANMPGLFATWRLNQLGAHILKAAHLTGHPKPQYTLGWFRRLTVELNLSIFDGMADEVINSLENLFSETDLLITDFHLEFPGCLGVSKSVFHSKYPQLCHVEIVAIPAAIVEGPMLASAMHGATGSESVLGKHDTLTPEISAGEQVVINGLALLFARDRGRGSNYVQVEY